MAIRTFKNFSIVSGGNPQPLVGTTMTAAIVAGVAPQLIPVADSSMFAAGDWAYLDTPGASEERVLVLSVPDSTHINVPNVTKAHASGSLVRSGILCNSVYVQSLDGNSAALYVGNSPSLVKATGVFVMKKIQFIAANGVIPDGTFGASLGAGMNGEDLGAYWIDGTTSDKYLPSANVA